MRPATLDEVVGQTHLLVAGSAFRAMVEQGRPVSMILWGPPGTGKTTLARLVASETSAAFEQLSAVSAGVKDVRAVLQAARQRLETDERRTILFLDEIHRFTKSQQDALLPGVEDGTVVLVGATTENPFFEVNSPLISRCTLFRLEALTPADVRNLIERAIEDEERGIAADKVLDVHQLFTSTCIRLTEGQFLDMRFEQRERVEVDEYMRMISGKTAALIGAAIAIGAHIGGATPEQDDALRRFGEAMGLAFQIQDDILGIWGDPAVTGKAAGNDILRRKKTLPLLHALNDPRIGADLRELLAGDLSERDLPRVMALFEESGTRGYVDDRLRYYHDMGIAALGEALGERAAGSALMALSDSLLHRAA